MPIKTTQNTSRVRVRSILLIVCSLALGIYTFLTFPHRDHDDLYSKIEYYNSQLLQKGKGINWDDEKSLKVSLIDLQKTYDGRAPYLENFTAIIHRSYVNLRPEDTVRSADTLLFLAWHKVFLQNLAYQKGSQQLIDSLSALLRMMNDSSVSPPYKSEFKRKLELLFSNESAALATHIIEDSLHKRVGSMQMAD